MSARKLKRSQCSVLTLVLKGKWYDLIASGEKKEEYRDDTYRYRLRLNNWFFNSDTLNKPMVVAFSRGYTKPNMFFVVNEFPDSTSAKWHPEWGEPDTPHYVIKLSERVELID